MVDKTSKGISPTLLRFFLISSSLFLFICGIYFTSLGLYFLYHASGIGVDRNFLFLPASITVLGFVAMTLLAIVCQVIAGAVVLALSKELAEIAAAAIRIKVDIANSSKMEYIQENEAFRSFQITMNCCGANGPSDYQNAKVQCCVDNTCRTAPTKGCVNFVKEVALKYKVPYGLMMIVFGVMQISAIVSSIAWAKWERKPLLV
ncbi:hypothetical protein ACTXT7_014778 [Hymenolepis weldensis]